MDRHASSPPSPPNTYDFLLELGRLPSSQFEEVLVSQSINSGESRIMIMIIYHSKLISHCVYLSDATEADVTNHSLDNTSIDMEHLAVVDEWSPGRCHGDEDEESAGYPTI